MKSFEDKINIVRAKTNLANRKGETIYIDCDLTRRKQEMQKKLRTIAVEEKRKGNIVKKLTTKIIRNKATNAMKMDMSTVKPPLNGENLECTIANPRWEIETNPEA